LGVTPGGPEYAYAPFWPPVTVESSFHPGKKRIFNVAI